MIITLIIPFKETLLGAAAGFGIMLFFYFLGILFSRFMKRQVENTGDDEEALGSGSEVR